MTRPSGLKTKIFLDGADPKETKRIIGILGFLDGQTTNPTLITKNPDARSRLERGEGFAKDELWAFYRDIVREISSLIPEGSVSIEVYADMKTTAREMLEAARILYTWIPNAHIKFPANHEGFAAAEEAIREGMRVNMTLVFSQTQAAAVYAATKGAQKGAVFISPFVGRLDDKGFRGIRLIENILRMYQNGDGHVTVLAASIRNPYHMLGAFELGCGIISAPGAVLKKWHEERMPLHDGQYQYQEIRKLDDIPFENIRLDQPWQSYNIRHELTDKGIEKFSADWNALLR